MFALKPRMKIVVRVLLITVFVFNAFVPVSAIASPASESGAADREDILNGFTVGASEPAFQSRVPILSEEIAKQAADLALLSQNMLKGEELTKFIKRSIELI